MKKKIVHTRTCYCVSLNFNHFWFCSPFLILVSWQNIYFTPTFPALLQGSEGPLCSYYRCFLLHWHPSLYPSIFKLLIQIMPFQQDERSSPKRLFIQKFSAAAPWVLPDVSWASWEMYFSPSTGSALQTAPRQSCLVHLQNEAPEGGMFSRSPNKPSGSSHRRFSSNLTRRSFHAAVSSQCQPPTHIDFSPSCSSSGA